MYIGHTKYARKGHGVCTAWWVVASSDGSVVISSHAQPTIIDRQQTGQQYHCSTVASAVCVKMDSLWPYLPRCTCNSTIIIHVHVHVVCTCTCACSVVRALPVHTAEGQLVKLNRILSCSETDKKPVVRVWVCVCSSWACLLVRATEGVSECVLCTWKGCSVSIRNHDSAIMQAGRGACSFVPKTVNAFSFMDNTR